MVARVTRVGLLAVLAVAAVAGPAEGFGRRATSVCSYPPGCLPHPPVCYCPPAAIPVGIDCVCNHTDQTLRIHVSSAFGHVEAVVPPRHCYSFYFRKDNTKPRVVTAFNLDNDVVANFEFAVIDQCPLPRPVCLPITGTTAAPMRAAPQRHKMEGAGAPTPSLAPLNGHAII